MSGPLAEVLGLYRDRPWLLVQPLGNWGDSLLYVAAERMATAAGLRWSPCGTFDFERLVTVAGHCIYLQGGGGLNPWSSGRAFANLVNAVARPGVVVVQGPCSVGGDEEWLRDLVASLLRQRRCERLVFIARERASIELLEDAGLQGDGISLVIDHDTALSLTSADLLELSDLATMPAGRYHLVVTREDNEQPVGPRSTVAAFRNRNVICMDPAREALTFRQWLRMHLFATTIQTDRLHSAIAGVVAGKHVTLAGGSYHKNRKVWEFSLAARGVEWTDSVRRPAAPAWDRMPGWIRGSYKVRRLRLAAHRVPLA